MGNKKSRIDTNRLFENMAVKANFLNQEEEKETTAPLSEEKKSAPEKPELGKEKNIQVSIYLRPGQAKELRIQNALREKETDKSALARTGIDIALQMSSQCYSKLKQQSIAQNILPGKLIEEALEEYWKKN